MPDIVDVHSHLWAADWLPEAFWDGYVDLVIRENEKEGRSISREKVWNKYLPSYWDPTGEHLLERMDEVGIDHQIVFGVDFGLALGDPPTPIIDVNRKLAEFRDEHLGRISVFATIDPRRDNAVSHIETAFESWDMDGLKLHPTAGFYLHDEETYELLELAESFDRPVLTDTGPIFAPLYSKYSHPIHLDEVLTDFPSLTIIAAHMSFEWWRDLHAIATSKVNTGLHVDISGWQSRATHYPELFANATRHLMDAVGAHRIHFGTDDPVFDPLFPKEAWIENISGLSDRESAPLFEEDEINLLLGEGAKPLLRR